MIEGGAILIEWLGKVFLRRRHLKRDLKDERANDVKIWGKSSLSRGNKGTMKDVKGNNLEVFEEQQGACVAVVS